MLATTLALALLTACGGHRDWSDVPPRGGSSESWPSTTEDVTVGGGLAGETLTAAQWDRVVEDVRPLTYKVFNHGCVGEATGSAVLLSDTMLVTNKHVVEGARSLEVQAAGGVPIDVASWQTSSRDDLALMKIGSPIDVAPLAMGLSPTSGDLVAALGYPLGGDLAVGQGRVVWTDGRGGEAGLIKASMDVLPGNSGGPLVDTDGALIGVVRAIDLVEGWAVAVPVDRVKALLNGEGVETPSVC